MIKITQELLNELFEYLDGDLIRKTKPTQRVNIGDKAGSIHHTGYFQIKINGKVYRNHRLVFLMLKGYLPKFIDHIDGNKLNNRIENLRETTQQNNTYNRKSNTSMNGKPTSSKYKGVRWHKRVNKWEVSIQVDKKQKHIGYFIDEIEAAHNYNEAAIRYHGKFARLNKL